MKFSTDAFVNNVVTVTVAVIIFSMVALPIVTQAISTMGEDDEQLKMILGVIPIFIVIGILLACIYMFIGRKN